MELFLIARHNNGCPKFKFTSIKAGTRIKVRALCYGGRAWNTKASGSKGSNGRVHDEAIVLYHYLYYILYIFVCGGTGRSFDTSLQKETCSL